MLGRGIGPVELICSVTAKRNEIRTYDKMTTWKQLKFSLQLAKHDLRAHSDAIIW